MRFDVGFSMIALWFRIKASHLIVKVCHCRATTHSDLVVRAWNMGVQVQIIHNASVMNAVGACGLQLYRFGEAISIPFFTETWRPDSFYDKIKSNRLLGLHTLCLLGNPPTLFWCSMCFSWSTSWSVTWCFYAFFLVHKLNCTIHLSCFSCRYKSQRAHIGVFM